MALIIFFYRFQIRTHNRGKASKASTDLPEPENEMQCKYLLKLFSNLI